MKLTRVYLAFSCRISYSAVTTILSRDICRGPSGFCLLVASLITPKRHPGRDANAILAANTKHYPLLFATVHCTCTLDERVTLVGKRTPHQNEVNPTSNRSPAINLNIKRLLKKGSPYSITERRVPELIPVVGSQPAGDMRHKPGGRLQTTVL